MKYRGRTLYHGTSAVERFERGGCTPDGPAWFSNGHKVAEWFAIWHDGEHPRILTYHVTTPPNLFVWSDRGVGKLLEDAGWAVPGEGIDVLEEMNYQDIIPLLCARGYDGWIIKDNYPDGHDIVLCEPGGFLKFVSSEPFRRGDR